jgi:hypothetical protein
MEDFDETPLDCNILRASADLDEDNDIAFDLCIYWNTTAAAEGEVATALMKFTYPEGRWAAFGLTLEFEDEMDGIYAVVFDGGDCMIQERSLASTSDDSPAGMELPSVTDVANTKTESGVISAWVERPAVITSVDSSYLDYYFQFTATSDDIVDWCEGDLPFTIIYAFGEEETLNATGRDSYHGANRGYMELNIDSYMGDTEFCAEDACTLSAMVTYICAAFTLIMVYNH